MLVISAKQEDIGRRIMVLVQPWAKARPYLKIT
jgi:hypothetical protein